jgi:hypothetical protein
VSADFQGDITKQEGKDFDHAIDTLEKSVNDIERKDDLHQRVDNAREYDPNLANEVGEFEKETGWELTDVKNDLNEQRAAQEKAKQEEQEQEEEEEKKQEQEKQRAEEAPQQEERAQTVARREDREVSR